MKVKVKVKHAPLNQVEHFLNEALSEALADLDSAHREIEKLFQENKDLRLEESHLRDDLACAQAQIESQRQAILHRDEQMLDQFEEIKAWSSKYATVCADRDNLEAAYKQVQESISKMVCDFSETRKELENEVKRVCKEKQDLFSWLADKDEEIAALQRVADENEERKDEITELRDENCNLLLKLESAEKVIESLETQLTRAELHNTLLENRLEETTAELVKHELNHYKDEAEEWKMTADKLSEAYRELLSKFTELQTEFNELNEDYDELAKAKREYAEEIDRLRNENKGLRNQMPLPEFMRQFIEMTREAVRNEFPDSGNS